MGSLVNIDGKRFGRLTVIKRKPKDSTRCLCRCDCGTVKYFFYNNLKRGITKSCGCYQRDVIGKDRIKDLSWKRFGMLLVLSRSEFNKNPVKWYCICDCGSVSIVSTGHLSSGHTKSCGCIVGKASKTHGMTNTKTYRAWCSILRRCTNKNSVNYKWYGGRGIKVCEEWKTFKNFYMDVGEIPAGLELDRINNDGDYEPNNCRIVTHKENCNNRRNNK